DDARGQIRISRAGVELVEAQVRGRVAGGVAVHPSVGRARLRVRSEPCADSSADLAPFGRPDALGTDRLDRRQVVNEPGRSAGPPDKQSAAPLKACGDRRGRTSSALRTSLPLKSTTPRPGSYPARSSVMRIRSCLRTRARK